MKFLVVFAFWWQWLSIFVPAVLGRPLLWRRSGSDSTTPSFVVGSYIGVRPKAYEGANKYNSGAPPHPAVLINTGPQYQVAMISNNHPHNPPQVSLAALHPAAGLQGNVNLHTKTIAPEAAKPWKGSREPMPPHAVSRLTQLVHAAPPALVAPNYNAPLGGTARPRGFNKKQGGHRPPPAHGHGPSHPPHGGASSSRAPHPHNNPGTHPHGQSHPNHHPHPYTSTGRAPHPIGSRNGGGPSKRG